MAAQHFFRGGEVATHDRIASARAGKRPSTISRDDGGDGAEPERLAEELQCRQIPGAILAESEVLAHDHRLCGEAVHEQIFRELRWQQRREARREGLDDDPVGAVPFQGARGGAPTS